MELFIVFVVVGFILLVASGMKNEMQTQLRQSEKNYRDSLENLKNNPTNSELKQSTLAYGRVYSNLTRNQRGVTVYDEMAIMNDINAACAGATISDKPHSLADELLKFKQLVDSGIITNEEYETKKRQILG